MSMRPLPPVIASDVQLFLAFDYGEKRTGVASGNRLTLSATPFGTIAAQGDAKWPQIAQYLKDWSPQAVVIGCHGTQTAPTIRTRLRRKSLADKSRVVLP